MKRFFCVLFACMLVLGAAMAIYGYQNGASTSLYWSDGHVYTEKEFDSLAESEEWTELPEGVSGLALELNNADVTIRQGDVFHISADYQRGSAPEATVENGVLRLRDEASAHIGFGFSLGLSRKENTVTIELPEGALTALDIRTGVGDLSLEDVHLETLTIEMDIGDAALKGVSSESLSVQCDIGDFVLEGGQFDTAEFTMNMGTLSYSGAVRTTMLVRNPLLLRRGAHHYARAKRHGRCGSFRRARGGDRGERKPRNRAHRFASAPQRLRAGSRFEFGQPDCGWRTHRHGFDRAFAPAGRRGELPPRARGHGRYLRAICRGRIGA